MTKPPTYISKRAQQIMDLIYQMETATAVDIEERLQTKISNSAIRSHLRALEEQGHLTHQEVNGKFVYRPTEPRQIAVQSALARLIKTFFGGSTEQAVVALLGETDAQMDEEALGRIEKMIQQAKENRDVR